jgi:cation transporter-like permease
MKMHRILLMNQHRRQWRMCAVIIMELMFLVLLALIGTIKGRLLEPMDDA